VRKVTVWIGDYTAVREIGERDAQDRPADAIPERIDVGSSRDLGRDERRGERPKPEVLAWSAIAQRTVGVAPGDRKRRPAVVDGVLDEAVRRLQIENVVLVDRRRYDHQRPGKYVGRRRVLDQLDQLVAIDDLTGRRGDILPDGER
jgi:hypothetical protein